MRAVIWQAPGQLTITEAADPAPQHGELIIQVGICGICGTDLHIADGEFPPTPYPIIPGHEFAGRSWPVVAGFPATGRRVRGSPWIPRCSAATARRAASGAGICARTGTRSGTP